MRSQSVSEGVRARAWHAAISACMRYGPRRAVDFMGAFNCGQSALDQELIPQRAVLVEE